MFRFLQRHTMSVLTRLGVLALTMAAASGAAAQDPVVIGYAISKTGANAIGAGISTRPNYTLWVEDVNANGGLLLPDGSRRPIEVIEYDDRSSSQVLVRAVERLISQDKVDLILPPWGTKANLTVASLLSRHGYPQLAVTAVSNDVPELVKRWPRSFWLMGSGSDYAREMVKILTKARDAGKINSEVALIYVADGLGADLAGNATEILAASGFRVVYERDYPLGQVDLSSMIRDVMHLKADSFVALTYPSGTFGVTKSAQELGFNPKVFFVGSGGAYTVYPKLTHGPVNGVFSLGGIDPKSPEIKAYLQRHQERIGAPPDLWASVVTYTSLQMLEQAIARVGLDHAALAQELATGRFDTLIGEVQLVNNQLKDLWLIGQWQDGAFHAIAPENRPGTYPPIIPKPKW